VPTYANIVPAAVTDGAPYTVPATAIPATNADNDLAFPAGNSPIPVSFGASIEAEVTLAYTGSPATSSTFVVMQTDLGDGNWIDVAWIVDTSTSGTITFFLSGGVGGAGAVKQSRTAGAAPASNSSNQMPLGGRIRFVGRATFTGGATPAVTALIRYKLLGLR
jgi:hypothetical protein